MRIIRHLAELDFSGSEGVYVLFSRSLGKDGPLSLGSNLRYGWEGLVVRKAREKGDIWNWGRDGKETGKLAARTKGATSGC